MKQAILEALNYVNNGVEAVIIREDDGTFEACPASYMNDASYTGSRDVVTDITEDGFGDAFDITDTASWDETAEWMANNYGQ